MQIFIVEDEFLIAEELSLRLSDLGHEVVGRAGEAKAAVKLHRDEVDLVLMDVRLRGELDGVEAARLMKDGAGPPVIFITAFADRDLVERARDVDPYGFLVKPVADDALAVTLQLAEGRLRAERERREAQAHRQRAESLYHAIMEASVDGVIAVDSDGRVVLFSSGAERMFGWSAEEMVGERLDRLLPADVRHKHHDWMQVFHLEDGHPRSMAERRAVTGVRRDGVEFSVEVSIGAVDTPGGRLLTGVVRDLTVRRSLERQLDHAQRLQALGQFTASIAHDFRNVLSVVLSSSELLMMSADPQLRLDIASDLGEVANHGAELARQLVLLARPEAVVTTEVRPDELIKRISGVMTRLLGRGLQVAVECRAPDVEIRISPTHLEQILINLITNARDAMGARGKVIVRTRLALCPTHRPSGGRPCLVLEVVDSGKGMTEEQKVRCFEPFFTTKGSAGSGVGLSSVRRLVAQAGGKVEIDSEPGVGTTMRIIFPTTEKGDQRPFARLADPETAGSGVVIMVQPAPVLRRLLVTGLEALGHEVLQVSTSAEVMRLARSLNRPLNALVVDQDTPLTSGEALGEVLRRRWPDIRIVLLHGAPPDGGLADDRDTNVVRLLKPVAPLDLDHAIRADAAGSDINKEG